jgi:hypothetical protein
VVLALLDLGSLALCVVRLILAFRFSQKTDARIVCWLILWFGSGDRGVVIVVPYFSVDLGDTAFWHLYLGRDFHFCTRRQDCFGGEALIYNGSRNCSTKQDLSSEQPAGFFNKDNAGDLCFSLSPFR